MQLTKQQLKHILEAATKAITEHGSFLVVLAGGSTPKAVYQALEQNKKRIGHIGMFITMMTAVCLLTMTNAIAKWRERLG